MEEKLANKISSEKRIGNEPTWVNFTITNNQSFPISRLFFQLPDGYSNGNICNQSISLCDTFLEVNQYRFTSGITFVFNDGSSYFIKIVSVGTTTAGELMSIIANDTIISSLGISVGVSYQLYLGNNTLTMDCYSQFNYKYVVEVKFDGVAPLNVTTTLGVATPYTLSVLNGISNFENSLPNEPVILIDALMQGNTRDITKPFIILNDDSFGDSQNIASSPKIDVYQRQTIIPILSNKKQLYLDGDCGFAVTVSANSISILYCLMMFHKIY